jgi:hypothetical protein
LQLSLYAWASARQALDPADYDVRQTSSAPASRSQNVEPPIVLKHPITGDSIMPTAQEASRRIWSLHGIPDRQKGGQRSPMGNVVEGSDPPTGTICSGIPKKAA